MPERHPSEHQEDGRKDDGDVDEEIGDEGIQCIEGSRAGGRTRGLVDQRLGGSEGCQVDQLIGWPVGQRDKLAGRLTS